MDCSLYFLTHCDNTTDINPLHFTLQALFDLIHVTLFTCRHIESAQKPNVNKAFSMFTVTHISRYTQQQQLYLTSNWDILKEIKHIFRYCYFFQSPGVVFFLLLFFCPPEISKVACKLKVSTENKNSIIFEDENYH